MSSKIIIENEQQLISVLKEVIEAIKTKENPEELNQYRRIFKKNVPLTMRSYVAAYLIKQTVFTNNTAYGRKDFIKSGKPVNPAFKQGFKPMYTAKQRVTLPENETSSIFIGIGRKRGIFPKDIITLLIQGAGIARDRIGGIRILDNYSFVQVMNDEAEIIIQKLNNSYFRGKSLTVSHSRKPSDFLDGQEIVERVEIKETERELKEEIIEESEKSQEIVTEEADISGKDV